MNSFTALVGVAAVLGIVAGCGGGGTTDITSDGKRSAQESENVRNSATNDLGSENSQRVVTAGNGFGIRLLSDLINSQASNLMVSPLSLNMALGMALNGAAGETKAQMAKTMGVSGVADGARNATSRATMLLSANIDPKVEFIIANSIWTNSTIEFDAAFLKQNEDNFGAEVSAIDFSNPSSLNTINGWVSQKTKGRIPTILDQIPANAGAYLINAVYFKGLWKDPFSIDNTHNGAFSTAPGQSVEVPMMNRRGDYEYFEDEKMQAIRIPYGSDRLAMILILPAASETLDSFVSKLSSELVADVVGKFKSVEVDLSLPKFTFSTELKLKDALIQLGMPNAFSPSKADFSAMRAKGELFLQDVVQKTWIQVDEEGTEAAASTSVEVGVTAIPQTVKFVANRPFLFAIADKVTKQLFFVGVLRDPRGT